MKITVSLLTVSTFLPALSWATPVSECMGEGDDCTGACERRADEYRNAVSPLTAYTGSQCTLHNTYLARDEVGCDCSLGSGWHVVAKAGYGDCPVPGRVPGTCLYTASEFPGCDLDAGSTSCASPCSDLQARVNAEESRSMDASVLGSTCYFTSDLIGGYGTCDCALQVEGTCFVNGRGTTPITLQDCAVTPEEMIRLHRAANTRGCGCSSPSLGAPVALALGALLLSRRRKREGTK